MSLTEHAMAAAAYSYGLEPLSSQMYARISTYIDLVLRWNRRLSLTGARGEMQLLQEHIFEGVFLAQRLPQEAKTLLDFGSGMGIPGVPVAICKPGITVTLAEARGRRASFLREVGRTTGVNFEVYAGRVEQLPAEMKFDVIAMRAVDDMMSAIQTARQRLAQDGYIYALGTELLLRNITKNGSEVDLLWRSSELPGSSSKLLLQGRRSA